MSSWKLSMICREAGTHVAIVCTFSDFASKVTAFSALALASVCGDAI